MKGSDSEQTNEKQATTGKTDEFPVVIFLKMRLAENGYILRLGVRTYYACGRPFLSFPFRCNGEWHSFLMHSNKIMEKINGLY